ncbi:class I SAM-dependent methyltransferase [Sungkyunkwania multivorans]|uniref:Class I SAM-dependent methyltransferase n=1 Tax=Sungkyunkwania multivorans TaxID=1173618 RepID=A0ABW3D1R5_9FLAO
MNDFDRKQHWEHIYSTKSLHEVSWYQPTPEITLNFFQQLDIPLKSNIIDVGGGDSSLVDHLLDIGYRNLTVLDISEVAIEKAKQRLGERADLVNWLVTDIADFMPEDTYEVWHDRAAFHFLTEEKEIEKYIETAYRSLSPDGILIMGTFSEDGPTKCSGIEIKQYSEASLTDRMKRFFEKIHCLKVDHKTPSGSIQSFLFCAFRRATVKAH